jgi:hypothetical protein
LSQVPSARRRIFSAVSPVNTECRLPSQPCVTLPPGRLRPSFSPAQPCSSLPHPVLSADNAMGECCSFWEDGHEPVSRYTTNQDSDSN